MPTPIKSKIRDALIRGEELTHLTALQRYGTGRLAAIVHTLRREGMEIESAIVPVTTSDGRVAHVARYWMQGNEQTD